MATLHLIRHGQANFGSSDYDKLSELGWQQGRVSGRFLRRIITPAAVFRGDLRRHRETAGALAEGFGAGFPAPQVNPAFNEFDHIEVIRRYRPSWADPQQMTAELARADSPRKAFQRAFAESVGRWVSGEHDHDYSETWTQFSARVWQALEGAIEAAAGVTENDRAADTVIVTSGGPISVIIQKLLGLGDRQALELNALLANAGLTRVRYARSGDQRSLAAFNCTAHLELQSAGMVTYR